MPAAADPQIAAIFRRPFAEQVAFFRGKLGRLVPTAVWRDLLRAEHDRAFMVAGAAKADLLADLAEAVDKAIADGETLEQFRKRFADIVQKHGWQGWTGSDSEAGRAWRTRVIYQTNLQTSYAAGRLVQLQDFPLWVYRHGGSRDPRPQHLAWNGLTLPADHRFWKTHYPPSAWGCTCYVLGARSAAGAQRLGGAPGYTEPPAGWDVRDARGNLPGVDAGWDYQPGSTVIDAVRAMAGKLATLPAQIGADLGIDLAMDKLVEAFGAFFDQALANRSRPEGKWMIVGAMKPVWVQRMKEAGVSPSTAEIAIRDRDIAHAFRDAKDDKLSVEWFRMLPVHLRSPQAVILDETHNEGPALLLIFDAPDATKKLIVRVNYRLKKVGEMNLVQTGQIVDLAGIVSSLEKGYALLDGKL